MNSIKLGSELKKLVFKRKLGGGEFSYVSLASGEERRGKGEILWLLVLEEGWKSLLACKGGGETDACLMKKVKKQIPFVLFENQIVRDPNMNNPPSDESLNLENGKTFPHSVIDSTKDGKDCPQSETEELNVVAVNSNINRSVINSTEHGKNYPETESHKKKRKKVKMGPASKVKRQRSESPDKDTITQINRKIDESDIISVANMNESLDSTVPYEATDIEDTDVLDKTKGLSDNESEEAEDYSKAKLYFKLASVPKVEEVIEIEDLPDIDEEEDDSHYRKSDEERRVLVFNVNKKISHSDCRTFFSTYDRVENVKRTLTRRNSKSETLKYKGVYLISFETEKAAQDFISSDVKMNEDILDKTTLSQYEKEKFFQRQIQRCKAIESKHQIMMSQIKDLKKSGKLDNCVCVQICSSEVSDDRVQEYFCGFFSEFIDKFGKPVEEARKIIKEDQKAFVEYILVFELQNDATLFVKNPEVHKFGDLNLRVLLLTDSMKRIRFSQKPKNYVDDKQLSEVDNPRRVAIQTVNKSKSEEEIDKFFNDNFPKLVSSLRCEINGNFWGLYILTFEDKISAINAVNADLAETDFVRNPMMTPLFDYLRLREKYLKQDSCPRKIKSSSSEAVRPWNINYQNIETTHQAHWGDIETEYKALYGRIEHENYENQLPPEKARNDTNNPQPEFDFDVIIGCDGFGDLNERYKQDIEEYFYENHENVNSVLYCNFVFVKFSDRVSAARFFTLNYIRFKGRKISPFKLNNYFDHLEQEAQVCLQNILFRIHSRDDSDDAASQNSRALNDDEFGNEAVVKMKLSGFTKKHNHLKILLSANLGDHFGSVEWKEVSNEQFEADVEVTTGPDGARKLVNNWNEMGTIVNEAIIAKLL